MGPEKFLAGAMLMTAISGVPGLFTGRRSSSGQSLATAFMVLGCLCGLWGAGDFLLGDDNLTVARSAEFTFPSPITGIDWAMHVDPLSVLFVIPVCVIGLLGSVYGTEYWKQADHPENGRKLRLFYGLLSASLLVVFCSSNSITFLFGWEGMALSAFLLVTTEDDNEQVRNAGWLYFGASHLATVCLFALFALMAHLNAGQGNHRFDFVSMKGVAPTAASAIFLLALLGFGTKAGLMHFWLPSAHAMAPSHVSAMMSGVLIKSGIYGLMRITSLVPHPPAWWGGTLLTLGAISGIFALAFAVGQKDLKRALAYSSVENIGVICMGLGLALLGRTANQPVWVVLGLGGALLHVWSHSLFKSLLFFAAGGVIHSTATREINLMGGLSKAMPRLSLLFVIGALAASALPPFNGFASEFLIYLGLFDSLQSPSGSGWTAVGFAVPALAMIGALAVACMVNLFGIVFLGTPRSEGAKDAHEPGWPILVPMGILATACALLGCASPLVIPVLQRGVGHWMDGSVVGTPPSHSGNLDQLDCLYGVSLGCGLLIVLALVAGLWLRWRLASAPYDRAGTWGCGYLAPTPRLQYTASSFSEVLVKLFRWVLYPHVRKTQFTTPFPTSGEFESAVPDTVLNRVLSPLLRRLAQFFAWFRVMQQGHIEVYFLYIFVILVVLMLWR